MGDKQASVNVLLGEPLARLRAGTRAVGFVGADVPIDVLLASGRPFGHLPWQAARRTPWADRWLESSFPFWARSILEQWHLGAFDALETVVFSRADDASQRLFYYVCELQRRGALRGPTPHVFDIALLPRESSAARTVTAIEALARALGVEPGALPGGIERANALRRALDALQQRRAANGPQHERIGRAALWSDATQWFDHTAVPTAPAQGPRVLLAGSVPPDDRLHGAVEDGGACVVAEAHVHGLARLGPEVSSAESSAEVAIARQLRHASISPRAILDRAAWLVAEVRRARAAAVVLWLTREDEALAWHVPAQRAALAAAGIPALILPAADWAGEDGALERIAAFCARIDYAGA